MIFTDEAYKLATIAAVLSNGTGVSLSEYNARVAIELVVEAEKQLYRIEHFEEKPAEVY
jgi:hypothetical protein